MSLSKNDKIISQQIIYKELLFFPILEEVITDCSEYTSMLIITT